MGGSTVHFESAAASAVVAQWDSMGGSSLIGRRRAQQRHGWIAWGGAL